MAQVAKTDTSREALRGTSVRDIFKSQRDLGASDLMAARAEETRATTPFMTDLLESRAEVNRSTARFRSAQQEAVQTLTPERVKSLQADTDLARKQVEEFFPMRYMDEEFQVQGRHLLSALAGSGMSDANKLAILKYNNETGEARGIIEPLLIDKPKSPRAISEYQNWNRTAKSPYIYLNIDGKVTPTLLPPVKLGGQWVQLTAEEVQNAAEKAGIRIERYVEMLRAQSGQSNLTAQEQNFDLIGE